MSGFLIPDWPAPPQVRTLVTTRQGGVSGGPYASLNLGDHVGDDPAAVAANRAILRRELPVEPAWLRQVHGVQCVEAAVAAPGCDADASVAFAPGSVCAVLTADCLPVLFCDVGGTAVAAAHAGWRGLAAGVLEKSALALRRPPGEVMAWLGPAIGPTAFEVGDEVRAAFVAHDAAAAKAFAPHGAGKWLCDLYELARQRLADVGVRRVSGGGFCTVTERERFYSYRRDGATGRMASLIWLDRTV
ncbi:MAG: peptidoglycan editing factor PgeF [Gammaproteobacteria bacterium]|nr:peptidoglycan editing factor PgeF [Gammaproteobacteria bacterium]MBU1646303.1 peptidoglycan editing factor PgeF [Gammaproteobacteria bacterium]MBU1970846.1 peptidoglycan editing factor PgeF [Gammaproteobacteria bacterium]